MAYDIRGGQGISPFVAIGEKYGDQLVKKLVEAGANIEAGLQRVTTNRELQGMSQMLSQMDPHTPDYTQKLMALKGQFPLAAQDPRGLSSVAMGFKEHMAWKNGQQAVERATTSFNRSKALVDYKASKKVNDGVDLSGLLGGRLTPQNPAANAGFSFGVDAGAGSQVPLAGMNGSLEQNSEGFEGILPSNDFQPVGKPTTPGGAPMDPLARRALMPLAETQQLTGVKAKPSQAFSAVAAERTRVQQQAMQEDRQAQQDKRDAEKEAERAIREAKAEKKTELTAQRNTIKTELSSVEREIPRLSRLVTAAKKAMEDFIEDMDDTKENRAKRTALEGAFQEAQIEMQDAGKDRTRLIKELEQVGKEEKSLSKEEAAAILKEVGGDKEKARALARERGFTL